MKKKSATPAVTTGSKSSTHSEPRQLQLLLPDPVAPPARPPSGPLTASAIRAAIASWGDIPASRRRNWASGFNVADGIVRKLEAKTGIPGGPSRWTCNHLNVILWKQPAAFCGLSDRRFGEVVSQLRQILIRLGAHADTGTGRNELSPAWQALQDGLPTHERRAGLVRFLRFLTLADVAPTAVAADALERFTRWLHEETLTEDIPALVRRTASTWTWAMRSLPGWPQVELSQPGMRDEFTTPIEEFPLSFQQDVAHFLDGLRGQRLGKIYDAPGAAFTKIEHGTVGGDGSGTVGRKIGGRARRNRAQSPRTIQTRTEQIRAAAAALLQQGVPLETITGLKDLVTPSERPRRILEFHLARLRARIASRGPRKADDTDLDPTSGYVAALAEVLRMIAIHHADLPEPEINEILELRDAVRPDAQGTMNEDVARKLRNLNEPDTLAMLLHLPEEWIRRLPKLELSPRNEALLFMYATALEILLAVPLRRRNLIELHLDNHLIIDQRTGAVTKLDIPASATKTRKKPIIWEFGPRVAAMIGTYIRKYRPLLAHADNRFLFPGGAGTSTEASHRDFGDFANELSSRVERELGANFNLHLARHLTAFRILKRMPGAYELVSRVLGHASPKTTMAYYCGLEMVFAVREASRLLELDRIESNRPPARFAVARTRVMARRRQTRVKGAGQPGEVSHGAA